LFDFEVDDFEFLVCELEDLDFEVDGEEEVVCPPKALAVPAKSEAKTAGVRFADGIRSCN
jgi:hypothetical protein